MAGYFTSLVSSLLFFLASTFTWLATTTHSPMTTKPKRLVIKLVNSRHLNLSAPHIQPEARAKFDPTFPFHKPLLLINFSIGQPPTQQFALMDTGSPLVWIECAGFSNKTHHQQTSPLFDPSHSTTFRNLSCEDPRCFIGGKCRDDHGCGYGKSYAMGMTSEGAIAVEQLTFAAPNEGTLVFPDVVFGCSVTNERLDDARFNGLFGLTNLSNIVSMFGSKFSYCIGNLNDNQYKFHQLILGEEADFEGYTTPLDVDVFSGRYFITLERITIGGESTVLVDPAKMSNKVLIDTGTSVTWLVSSLYTEFRKTVERSMTNASYNRTTSQESDRLCYQGYLNIIDKSKPFGTLHFADDLDLSLDVESMFYQDRGMFCLAVNPSIYEDFSIMGIKVQQFYNVGFDIIGKTLYVQMIDCELLV